MKVTILHTADALEPPVDPVLDQLSGALTTLGHEVDRLPVDSDVAPLVTQLQRVRPDLVMNHRYTHTLARTSKQTKRATS